MSAGKPPVPAETNQPKWMTWVGWGITVLMAAQFTMSAAFKLMHHKMLIEGFEKFEINKQLAIPIGIVELICMLIYLFPRTAILGAILLTGYLGGAIMTHLRVNDNFAAPIIVAVLVWLGIFLRDPRLRSILFWR